MKDFRNLDIDTIVHQVERHSDDPFDNEVIRRLRVGEHQRIALEKIRDLDTGCPTRTDGEKSMRAIARCALEVK